MNSAFLKKRYLQIILLILLSGAFIVTFFKYKMEIETIKSGEYIKVGIKNVVCQGSVNNKNYIVISHKYSNHIINVDGGSCLGFTVGDSITVLYNRKYDLFFLNKINTRNERLGMTFLGLFFLVIVLDLIFPKVFKLK